MKKCLSIAALSTILLSTNVHAFNQESAIPTAIGTVVIALSNPAYAATFVNAMYVIIAVDLAGGTVAGGISLTNDQKKVIKNVVNEDAENFYTNGNLSLGLAQTVNVIKEKNPEFSDSEAVDLIVATINKL